VNTNRVSGGAADGTPTCPTCPHLVHDKEYPDWGWCYHPQNRVHAKGWPGGFTPSQSPSGSCDLHPNATATDAHTATDSQTTERPGQEEQ
jgi:hypothetical protein